MTQSARLRNVEHMNLVSTQCELRTGLGAFAFGEGLKLPQWVSELQDRVIRAQTPIMMKEVILDIEQAIEISGDECVPYLLGIRDAANIIIKRWA